MVFKKLTSEEERVIVHKGTEMPFSGEYWNNNRQGWYFCKRCRSKLFGSGDQFISNCGWLSFDDEILDSVKQVFDDTSARTEILCAACDGHLGHIFKGENLTSKNTRYCVNSIAVDFVENKIADDLETAYFAGGCFWGVEYCFEQVKGIKSTFVGYMGGKIQHPTYQQICAGDTKHVEAVEIIFDPKVTDFETLCRLFFEIHDPTQINGQGSDIGYQYRSVVFYTNQTQKKIAKKLITLLTKRNYKITTQLTKAPKFWKGELYHQNYYTINGKKPYCHSYVKRFN